jgi:tetratricopeptide (TPR) repeat protein
MEEGKRRLLAEAREREKHGQHKVAGDLFARAGAHDEAARVYLAGGHFAEAGQTLLRSSGYDETAGKTVAPSQRAAVLKAAICFSRAGDVGQAARLFLAIGERRRAVELLETAGDVVNAARIEADPTGQVELVGYAPAKVSRPEEELSAARRLEAAGKRDAAMEAFASLKQWPEAARLARALGKVDRAAGFFEQAAMPFEAAECFFACRDRDRALTNLYKVTQPHPRYRTACIQAIAACSDRGTLSFDLEHLVAHFQDTGPQSDAEVDAFYALALLFESHRVFESAADCYRKLLGRHPGYRDAEARLGATTEQDRGVSAQDFRRIVEEESAFRDAIKRHATPIATPAERADSDLGLPDLPALPDLPDLPDLPNVPHLPDAPVAVAEAPLPRGQPAPVPTQHVAASVALELGLLDEGVVINDRYRLDKKIGQGGMGSVYRAHDLELDEPIAIKFLATGLVDDEVIGRFKQEVSLSRQFSHPNVIRMYDLGSYGENKYITMELLEGQDLGSLLRAGPLPMARAIDLLVQACRALQVVHDHGVVHRDVKPDNFFLTKQDALKVMDFGIAKRQQANKGLTRAGTMAGTAQYVAPEQAYDFGGVTHLADIYALGCIAYQMFTGRVPFDGADVMPILMAHVNDPPIPPRAFNPAMPADIEAVILKLLAKRPERRVQSCDELATLLTVLRAQLP